MELLKEETENFREVITSKGINISMMVLDYAFFKEENYRGKKSHQEAAIKMIETLNIQRATPQTITLKNYQGGDGENWLIEMTKLNARRPPHEIKYTDALYFHNPNSPDFFKMPREEPYAVNIELMNAKQITSEKFFATKSRKYRVGTKYYAGAFLNLPYHYSGTIKDFYNTNDYLFPNKESLIIYEWNNDWSNYFSTGKNWWGAVMWTVYAPERKRFTVVSASASD